VKFAEALEYLESCFSAGRLAHAYVVAGPPRGAAGALAETVVQIIFCEAEEKPCGKCRVCRQVSAHQHPDLLWIEPQLKSRRISVDQIRDLQRRVCQTAFSAGWKACVLAGADRLGKEASNAFLKTLEEPPGRTILFLLSDSPQFLLPTVLSRCQMIMLNEEGVDLPEAWHREVMGILEGDDSDYGGVEIAAWGRAERLGSLLAGIKKAAAEMEKELADREAADAEDETLDARINSRYRELRRGLMRVLERWFRDVLLLVVGGDFDVLCHPECAPALARRAQRLTYRQALRHVAVIGNMNRQLEQNIPEVTVLSAGFSELSQCGPVAG